MTHKNITEQVIRVDGRIIRVIPENKVGPSQTCNCQVIRVASDGKGFYRMSDTGFDAYDITHIWNARHDA